LGWSRTAAVSLSSDDRGHYARRLYFIRSGKQGLVAHHAVEELIVASPPDDFPKAVGAKVHSPPIGYASRLRHFHLELHGDAVIGLEPHGEYINYSVCGLLLKDWRGTSRELNGDL
jgi:hypothetical protein